MLDQVQQYLHLRGNFKLDVVFVCMDVEALEVPPRNHRFVQGCPDKFDFGQGRKLVFVGHDVANDIQLLKQVGFDVLNMEGLQGQCDTKDMHQAWKGLDSGRSLESILQELHIDYENLHNAGNDAAHTLQALIGIAVQDLRDQGRA
ncbi:Uncharacterized protein ESCO_000212 [Escovopsis weberi]|uniref:Gfd2/YDR514C-like C-terminal domain-containing protein n=1 Tax=Escovopsis weberi TaxID=150374 RepID=A0A0M8MU53_ESCWE|nr:Uncharacterized protein ESCO_000212 [Escovopsis weberi]